MVAVFDGLPRVWRLTLARVERGVEIGFPLLGTGLADQIAASSRAISSGVSLNRS